MKKTWIVLALLIGCAVPQPAPRPIYQRLVTFDPIDYGQYTKTGTGRIRGRAFLQATTGDVKTGALKRVIAVPVTRYSKEWFEQAVLADSPVSPPDSRADEFTHVTTTDDQGKFEFRDLPAGRYYILTRIVWEPSGDNEDIAPEPDSKRLHGGYCYDTVLVQDGAIAETVLTRSVEIPAPR